MSSSVSPEAVIITGELDQRPSRDPDHHAESRALVALMHSLNAPNPNVLQELAETALQLCNAQSAGIGIVEQQDGHEVFRWHASAGQWSEFLREMTPRNDSPCGTAVDRNSAILVRHHGRHFDSATDGVLPLAETLLVPFEVAGRTVGVVWVLSRYEDRTFDREDLRLVKSVSAFASVAYQVILQQQRIADALDRQRAGTQLLQSISSGLIVDDDTGPLYEQILDAAMIIMHSDFASLQTVDTNGELQLLASRGFHAQSAEFWQIVRLDSRSSCGATLRARQRFTIPDTESSKQLEGSEDLLEFRRSGIRSVQSTPLFSRDGTVLGVVSTHWRQPYVPPDSDLRIFDILVRETSDLIERANAGLAVREADRRKDEFIAVLGHELRNPLAPLRTGIELLQRAGHKPGLRDSVLSMMKRQLLHLTRLVDDLLDLSRISRGRIDLQRAPLDMNVVIEAAIELTRPLIEERRHDLVVEHDGGPVSVDGDLERLTQVVANLLGNAAKYMDPGGRIVLRTAREGDRAVIRIRDTGFGIPAERLEAIFEMFSQVPEHRARRGGGGLGIGLAMSRRLIGLHGGSLTAASEGLGRGSEFTVQLPLGAVAPMPKVERPVSPKAAAVPRRILVVDDNVDAAASLRTSLELAGHAITVVHDARASLRTLETFAPEVVLLDIGLPGMDGYQLARRIRSSPGGRQLLLVAITGWGQDSDRDRARAAGFDVHMTKPVSLDALEAVLARNQDGRPSGFENGTPHRAVRH